VLSGFSPFWRDCRPPQAWLKRRANVVRVTAPARGRQEELRAFFRPHQVMG
jgi:hypothetical protein